MITIPTLQELKQQIEADIEAAYQESMPTFGKVMLRAISAMQAGKIWLLYKVLGYIQKNVWADTADPEATGGTLERIGRIKLGRNPFPAVAGQYTIQITGLVGTTVPAKTTFKSDDDTVNPGMLYVLDNGFLIVSSPAQILVRALEAGTDSRLDNSDGLSLTAPIANVDKGATVVAEVVSPKAAETTEEYRQKIIDSFRTETQGGSVGDYRIWSEDAQGVAKVYPYASSGNPGQVDLFVEATVADSTDGKGTPSSGLMDEVEAVIELDPDTTKSLNDRGRRPIQVILNVQPITPLDIDIDIADYVNLTVDKSTLISTALDDMINQMRPFISGADILSEKNDIIDKNKIISAILVAVPGSTFGVVTLTVDGSPLDTYTFTDGNIPFPNSVNFS